MSKVRTIWICPACKDWQVDFDTPREAPEVPQVVEDVLRDHALACFGLTELLADGLTDSGA